MGAAGSINGGNDTTMAMDGSDVDTPRGVTAKAEVIRLRRLLVERSQQTVEMLANARFRELDTDNSGYLENEELASVVDWVVTSFGNRLGSDPQMVRAKLMARLDANKDGKLDPEEFEELFKEMINRMMLIERAKAKFQEFDANNSGTIEAEEINQVISWTLQAYPEEEADKYKKRIMDEIDANQDGMLDLIEFTNLFEDMLIRSELLKRAEAKFNELDADKSGFLERSEIDALVEWVMQAYVEKPDVELTQFKLTLLEHIDRNKDGKLDLKEFTLVFNEVLCRMDLVSRAKVQFQKYNEENNGEMDKALLETFVQQWAVTCLHEMGIDISDALMKMTQAMEINKNGKVCITEFTKMFDGVISSTGVWVEQKEVQKK